MRKAGSTRLAEARSLYAAMMEAAHGRGDERFRRSVEAVPREAFVPPGPWRLWVGGRLVETPSADPVHLYQNVLISLDASRQINNGEPLLHAAWMGAVAPQAGEAVCHVGVGGGYYTALLAMQVLPGGTVTAYEIEPGLAMQARHNLEPFENVTVVEADATTASLAPCDVLYVNAALAAPPPGWLAALKPGGRLIFPWQPDADIGVALMVTCLPAGFAVKAVMGVRFILCGGDAGFDEPCGLVPGGRIRAIRSLRFTAQEAPDETAVAVYRRVWFSSAPP